MDTHAVLGRLGTYLIVVFVRHGALLGSRLGRGEVVSAKANRSRKAKLASRHRMSQSGSGVVV